MEIGYAILLIYPIGFLLTILFFKFFGKKIGIDYDPPHDDWYDDYENSNHAFFVWSLFWPAMWIMGGLLLIYTILKKISYWILDYEKINM